MRQTWTGFVCEPAPEPDDLTEIVHFEYEDDDDNIIEIESYERQMKLSPYEEMLERYFESLDFYLETQCDRGEDFSIQFKAA